MGRSVTPMYRVEYLDNPFARGAVLSHECAVAWDIKSYGRPTANNLAKWRTAKYNSMKVGGVNEHISAARGYIPVISKARIVRQSNREVVATFDAPPFEVME